jgi:hypothetical protein
MPDQPDFDAALKWAEECAGSRSHYYAGTRIGLISDALLALEARFAALQQEKDEATKLCDHTPEYKLETDNYYCSKCHKGMGNAYYRLAKSVAARTKQRDEAISRANLRQDEVDGARLELAALQQQRDEAIALLKRARPILCPLNALPHPLGFEIRAFIAALENKQ